MYTKGEWKAKRAELNLRDPMFYKADVICGGIRIAHVAGVGEVESNANARLIASAPELLEACKEAKLQLIMNLQYLHDSERRYTQNRINDIEQAINKAEGKT